MPATVQIRIPRDMEPVTVAETFNAYLIGSLVFDRGPHTERHHQGPFRKEPKNELDWQLDSTNNYWLHIDKSLETARLECRYAGHATMVIEAMAKLFEVQYLR